jgi:hypothetical protein
MPDALDPQTRADALAYYARLTDGELAAAAERHARIASRKHGHDDHARAIHAAYGALILDVQAARAKARATR